MEQDKQMELKEFVEIALRDIFEGTKDAQKQILYGEIIPNKEGKTGEADIEFEIAVKPEDNKLVVIIPPAPPAPNLSKVKFKIPVRLPKRRGGFLHHLLEYYLIKRRKNKEKSAQEEAPSPPLQSQSPSEEAAKKEEQKTDAPKQ
ncbi:hypothetical protein [Candidatus Electronema sp. PJ]|uniref:hypothetical protein n=1 Tax=Candidatus Electronema sp. PJ TaxID=3401572 RepID=UPI003AA8DC1D